MHVGGSVRVCVLLMVVKEKTYYVTYTTSMSGYIEDPSSFVRLEDGQAQATAMRLDWVVDFERTRLLGSVTIKARALAQGPCQLTLDTRELAISCVTDEALQPLEWSLRHDARSDALGTPLVISLRAASAPGDMYTVIITYSTSSNASALQFLSPQQTTSGALPFLFSQCQAIHARSMLPCQDLCQVKVPYTAKVTYPACLRVLMSAVATTASPHPCAAPAEVEFPTCSEWVCCEFEQSVPIPPYLIAIVCGELVGRKIGPVSTVWAEPAVIERAAWEFADTSKMIEVATARCGSYRFGVFDLLVLPPSFPYGGMENPCLTFVTPTLLAGDRSQVAVVAHELAHSWSGNLVTNATWEHFWINEGLTVFNEAKIIQSIFGVESASIRMEEGWQHVTDDVNRMGCTHNFTCLCPRLAGGQDPDDAFSSVPYEKGAALFWYLESIIGSAAMETAVRSLFDSFAFTTITSQQLRDHFVHRENCLESVHWAAWFHDPGMPLFRPLLDDAPVVQAKALANACLKDASLDVGRGLNFSQWPSGKKCVFLNTMLLAIREGLSGLPLVTPARMSLLADELKLLDANAEIRCIFLCAWLMVCRGADSRAVDAARRLVGEQGRMKFVRPLYRTWFSVDPDAARSAFLSLRSTYHPIAVKMLERDLQL